MTIYSLYIFDRRIRHCICVYYHDWHRTRRPKSAVEGGILPAVSTAVFAPAADANSSALSGYASPRNTLSSASGIVVAVNEMNSQSTASPLLQAPPSPIAVSSTGLAFDEEVKLVYGVVLSLRNMIKKLSGRYEIVDLSENLPERYKIYRDEQFVNYRTSAYKLHLFETLSGYKFVMLSDPGIESMRLVLRQIYVGPFLEYVVRNPLISMDSKEHGIDNEYFRTSVDRMVRGLSFYL
ncbi:hypothetical protein D9757_000634 [Collybiopsis confluens]|uniref:Trafficking protein particle complex subunit n=1 Tax=Collybiopsis confluens TaxID=2823264 RepID=A0A8H5I1B6_9AGAR|nr:hypothetical protein D9757_000634 [Collybiopsis confluens]